MLGLGIDYRSDDDNDSASSDTIETQPLPRSSPPPPQEATQPPAMNKRKPKKTIKKEKKKKLSATNQLIHALGIDLDAMANGTSSMASSTPDDPYSLRSLLLHSSVAETAPKPLLEKLSREEELRRKRDESIVDEGKTYEGDNVEDDALDRDAFAVGDAGNEVEDTRKQSCDGETVAEGDEAPHAKKVKLDTNAFTGAAQTVKKVPMESATAPSASQPVQSGGVEATAALDPVQQWTAYFQSLTPEQQQQYTQFYQQQQQQRTVMTQQEQQAADLPNDLPEHLKREISKSKIVDVSGMPNDQLDEVQRRKMVMTKYKQQMQSSGQNDPNKRKPFSSTGRHRHQITFLAYDAQERELELAEKRAEGSHKRSQARQRYGF